MSGIGLPTQTSVPVFDEPNTLEVLNGALEQGIAIYYGIDEAETRFIILHKDENEPHGNHYVLFWAEDTTQPPEITAWRLLEHHFDKLGSRKDLCVWRTLTPRQFVAKQEIIQDRRRIYEILGMC